MKPPPKQDRSQNGNQAQAPPFTCKKQSKQKSWEVYCEEVSKYYRTEGQAPDESPAFAMAAMQVKDQQQDIQDLKNQEASMKKALELASRPYQNQQYQNFQKSPPRQKPRYEHPRKYSPQKQDKFRHDNRNEYQRQKREQLFNTKDTRNQTVPRDHQERRGTSNQHNPRANPWQQQNNKRVFAAYAENEDERYEEYADSTSGSDADDAAKSHVNEKNN